MDVSADIIINLLLQAHMEWYLRPVTGDKHVFFDDFVEDEFGLRVYFQNATLIHATVIDQNKYLLFLMKWA